MFFGSPHPFCSLHCTASGNVEALKDMPLTSLYLSDCVKLEGACVGGVGEGRGGCCPKATLNPDMTHNALERVKAYLPSPHLLRYHRRHRCVGRRADSEA